jgi:hypothetical protein
MADAAGLTAWGAFVAFVANWTFLTSCCCSAIGTSDHNAVDLDLCTWVNIMAELPLQNPFPHLQWEALNLMFPVLVPKPLNDTVNAEHQA